jgi:hypothetical protein
MTYSLPGWIDHRPVSADGILQIPRLVPRFAFYGRISTDGYQDPASSRQWQYDQAVRLRAGHGPVVAEYFDVGYSRCLPWHHRPHADGQSNESDGLAEDRFGGSPGRARSLSMLMART